jgi:hypothetical protein
VLWTVTQDLRFGQLHRNDTEMCLREIGWEGMDWIDLASCMEMVGSCEHGNEPLGSVECWKIPD